MKKGKISQVSVFEVINPLGLNSRHQGWKACTEKVLTRR